MKVKIFDAYVEQVAVLFNLHEHEIFEKSKKREVVDARHLIYYLCYHRPMKLKYIQNFMHGRGYEIGHSSIIHGIQMVKELSETDQDYKQVLQNLNVNEVV
jgi:chromosomal replication initiation ATPase DnaA